MDVNMPCPADLELLAIIENGFNTVGAELEAVRRCSALDETMKLAAVVNQYRDVNTPWSAIMTDKDGASKTGCTALKVIDSLKVMFASFLPFSCEKLHSFFGYETPLFGEQNTETVKDSFGEHTMLRYKGVEGLQQKPSELHTGREEVESAGSAVQEIGG